MSRIIIVSKGGYDSALLEYGEVVVSPAVLMDHSDGKRLGRKHLGILRAMVAAVEEADPGDLIMQDDMFLASDPFREVAPLGTIRTLNEPTAGGRHFCPRAFIISDEEIKVELLEMWRIEELRSCLAWSGIEKVYDYTPAFHTGVASHG